MSWMESLIERVLERASVRARTESPRAAELLAELAGQRLAVAVEGTPWETRPLQIESTGERLRLAQEHTEPAVLPRASIRGAPLSLLALVFEDPQSVVQRGQVHIEGDATVAERYRELGLKLAPDLEESLSHLVGRSVAHLLMRGLTAAGASARSAAWTSAQNLAEYFAHERGELVSRREAEHYMRGVEQAREQLDRLEARLARVEQRIGAMRDGSEPAA
jgi:ubiquinone biosynthesis protein UbiJ